jgi:hypothetical protein
VTHRCVCAGGALSSEASAIDDDAIDSMPDDAFPAGAKRCAHGLMNLRSNAVQINVANSPTIGHLC